MRSTLTTDNEYRGPLPACENHADDPDAAMVQLCRAMPRPYRDSTYEYLNECTLRILSTTCHEAPSSLPNNGRFHP
jgi:hypothetical protein